MSNDNRTEKTKSTIDDMVANKSIPDFIIQHLQQYAQDPVKAHLWDASAFGGSRQQPVALITVKGRSSGKLYSAPLVYAKDGESWIIAGSYGGAPVNPAWYENLCADDMRADFQVAEKKYRVQGRVLKGEERTRMWKKLADAYPPLDSYTQVTTREIPLVRLDIAK
jgi:deazaflavin-dependent oxidoreductase (nitroreductase family)